MKLMILSNYWHYFFLITAHFLPYLDIEEQFLHHPVFKESKEKEWDKICNPPVKSLWLTQWSKNKTFSPKTVSFKNMSSIQKYFSKITNIGYTQMSSQDVCGVTVVQSNTIVKKIGMGLHYTARKKTSLANCATLWFKFKWKTKLLSSP